MIAGVSVVGAAGVFGYFFIGQPYVEMKISNWKTETQEAFTYYPQSKERPYEVNEWPEFEPPTVVKTAKVDHVVFNALDGSVMLWETYSHLTNDEDVDHGYRIQVPGKTIFLVSRRKNNFQAEIWHSDRPDKLENVSKQPFLSPALFPLFQTEDDMEPRLLFSDVEALNENLVLLTLGVNSNSRLISYDLRNNNVNILSGWQKMAYGVALIPIGKEYDNKLNHYTHFHDEGFAIVFGSDTVRYKSGKGLMWVKHNTRSLNSLSHVVFISNKHPEGRPLFTVSIKAGRVIEMRSDESALYFKTVDDRNGDKEITKLWRLDIDARP